MANSRAILERGVAGRDEAHSAASVFSAVGAMEVGHGGVAAFGVGSVPVSEEADGQAAEHAEHPDAIAIAHAAVVFTQRSVQTLVQSALDSPVLTVGLQPLGGVQARGCATGDQPNDLGPMRADVSVQLRDLGDMREAHLFRRSRLAVQLPALPPAPIAFVAPSHGRRAGLRGKKRPVCRPVAPGRFDGSPFGCL